MLWGRTRSLYGCMELWRNTVEILLKHGASVEAVNNKGDNVFHSLIQVGLTPQTNLLLPAIFSIAPTIW